MVLRLTPEGKKHLDRFFVVLGFPPEEKNTLVDFCGVRVLSWSSKKYFGRYLVVLGFPPEGKKNLDRYFVVLGFPPEGKKTLW